MATAMFAFFAVAAITAGLTGRRAPVTGARNHDRGPVAAQEAATKESIP
jgi:hypothetical protein